MPRSELRATYTHLQCFIQIVQDKNRSYPAQRSLLPYHGHVESILTTAEGSTVACIWRKDAENTTQYIAVWLNATRTSFKHFIRVGTADKVLIAIDPSGKNLVVSKVCTNTDLTKISVWNFSGGKPVLIRARSVAGRVLAMSVDPSGMYVVYATPASAQSMVLPDLTDVIEDRHDFPRPIRLAAFSTDGQSFMAIDHMGEVTVRAGRAPWKSFQHCRPPPSTALPSQIKLHISPDGCTAIVSGPSDNPVDPVDVWIYRLPLAGQTELLSIQANVMKWVASSDASLIVIMQKEDDDWESPPFISVNRIKWQTRPHLQWIQGILANGLRPCSDLLTAIRAL
ncbi:hypothetical protein BKA62DRAFT_370007 [Auriculariales sp. MPI-PUGE-AT-0066]|nr:hypothetical protein BKA62DRAFT_370007 [Auriculariales sp. MPI-PUGE-AT-0066]